MANLARILVEAAGSYPDRPAVRQDDVVLTYSEFDRRSSRVAGWARQRGQRPGDRVGLMLPNVAQFPILYYGLLRAGVVVVPMNPLLKAREVNHCLTDSGAQTVLAWHAAEGSRDGAAAAGADHIVIGPDGSELDDAEPDSAITERGMHETAVILYTSGTTGTPKGAELTHANLNRNAELSARQLLRLGTDDVVMGCLPLFHTFGQTCALNAAIISGASITLLPRFDARRALEVIQRDRVTVFAGVPTMYTALAAVPDNTAVPTLRLCISGGAALPVEVLRNFEAAYSCQILEGYGLSETSPVVSFNRAGHRKLGSIGTPIDGVSMRLVDDSGADVANGDVGEIAVQGHNVMAGYWHQPEATAAVMADGWLRTGDLARMDADGFFFIVDRKKDMIIRGGFNVYPREIEEVLYEHPKILEAAVIGIPHPTHGEEVVAVVVVDGAATITADEVRDYVKARVAPYKYPRQVWFLDALPKGPTGKVLKRRIAVAQSAQTSTTA
jgi:long-chain acyl-CoA synthetase